MGLNKVFNIFVLLLLVILQTSAQSFYKVIGTEGNDYAKSIINDADSGYVIVGATEGIGQGGMDGYLLKVDTAGNLVYTRTFGGQEIDWLTDIKRIPTGFIISGYSNSFGNDYDAYVIQTDPLGVTIWETTIGGDSWDFANSIALTPDGNYIIAGESYSFSNGNADGFIAKVDSNGDTLWTKHFGGVDKDWFNDVAINEYGEIALCGVKTNADDETDFWIIKLDASGNLLWEHTLGDTLNDEGNGITYLSNGDIVTTGFNTFDDGNGIVGFYYKIDSSGIVKYNEGFFGPNDDYAIDVTTYTDTENCIITFASSSYGFGGFDTFVAELGVNLLPTNVINYSFGTQNVEYPFSLDTTFDKGVVVVGNINFSSSGANNIYINKTDSTSMVNNIMDEQIDLSRVEVIPKFEVWPNPANHVLNINIVGEYQFQIFDNYGRLVCSGIVSSQLDIKQLKSGFYILKIDGFKNVRFVKI